MGHGGLGTRNHGYTLRAINRSGARIPRGRAVKLYNGADPEPLGAAAGEPDEYIFQIDDIANVADVAIGVTVNPMNDDEIGEIIVMGLAWVETDGGVSRGEQLELDADGKFDSFAAGTKYGRAMMDDISDPTGRDFVPNGGTVPTYALAIVNFANQDI